MTTENAEKHKETSSRFVENIIQLQDICIAAYSCISSSDMILILAAIRPTAHFHAGDQRLGEVE